MDRLSSDGEDRLIKSVEKAIVLSKQGLSPTDAIHKVAVEEQLTPPFIQRITEAFNKSKSVNFLKESSVEDRAKCFSLADGSEVIGRIYGPETQKEAAAEFKLPVLDYSRRDIKPETMDKVASLRDERAAVPMHPGSALRLAENYRDVREGVRNKLYTNMIQEKYAFEQSIESVVEQIAPMTDTQLRKVAQLVTNGYPVTGTKMLRVFEKKLSREVPVMEKTAHSVTFPTKEPYLSISKVYECAEKYARASVEYANFQKQAEGFLSSLVANTAANVGAAQIGGPSQLGEVLSKKKVDDKSVEELLDPQYYNRIKELDAKRNFMNLVLYDDDLKDYNYSDLVKAYNSSVSVVPQAYDNPVILKNLMIRNIQSSGIKDPFELGQEMKLDKGMREQILHQQREEDLRAAKIEAAKPVRTPFQPVSVGSSPGIMDYLKDTGKRLEDAAKSVDTDRKSRGTRDESRQYARSEEERKKLETAAAAKTPEQLREEQVRSDARARLSSILGGGKRGGINQQDLQASGGAGGIEKALLDYYSSDGGNFSGETARTLRRHNVIQ